jgi:hypothetical protein
MAAAGQGNGATIRISLHLTYSTQGMFGRTRSVKGYAELEYTQPDVKTT